MNTSVTPIHRSQVRVTVESDGGVLAFELDLNEAAHLSRQLDEAIGYQANFDWAKAESSKARAEEGHRK